MKSAQKKSLVDTAYQMLRLDILNSELAPGTQLTEPELALRLGMSRTPVHEALLRLQVDGLVELIPRRGARVLSLSARDMREIYEILGALEPQVAYSLAQAGLDREQLSGLEQATLEMEKALADDDLDAWAAADRRFHDELLALNGNTRLAAMIRALSEQAHRARLMTVRRRRAPVRSTFEHRAIFDAIQRGDAKLARDSYARHRERSAQELLQIIEELEQQD